jgi:hypothetical protein
MLALARLPGQSIILETPSGLFSILLIKVNRSSNTIELRLKADWLPGHADVTLQSEASLKPQALASLASIRFLEWGNQGKSRVKLGIDAPRDWHILRQEMLKTEL